MPKHDASGHARNMPRYLLNHGVPAGGPSIDVWRQGLMDSYMIDVDASVLWESIGPAPLILEQNDTVKQFQGLGPNSGEVTDIAIDPDGSADQVIYVATNDGGIWKTTDGGATWKTTMDDLLGLSMGAVEVDPFSPQPTRVVYAGTGNMYDGGGEFTKGVGLYRSADGGSTWSIVDGGPFCTVFAGLYITAIRVLASDVLLVATSNGLYRSVDGGQNFGANPPTFNDRKTVLSGLITCLLLDSANSAQVVFAAVQGAGVMKSTNGGQTFPHNILNPAGLWSPGPPVGNIEIAQAEHNPQILFVSIQYGTPYAGVPANVAYLGLYISIDGGVHWTLLPSAAAAAAADGFNQTNYDLILGIDPQVAIGNGVATGLVYAGFQELWRSSDGGQTFEDTACTSYKTHWDLHALAFSPKSNRVAGANTPVYLGTDGGIYRSLDGGTTWLPLNGNGGGNPGSIGSNLFLGMDIGTGAGNNAYTYGGFQDTGCAGHRPGDIGTDWHQGINGDGGRIAVDPSDPKTVYGFDDGGFIKTIDAGASWQFIGNLPASDSTCGIALEQSGTDATKRTVYVGFQGVIYVSPDAGASFTTLYPTNLQNPPDIAIVRTTNADANRIWFGMSDGSVHYSANAGKDWDQGGFNNQPGPAAPLNGIAIDPKNPDRVAVVFGAASGIHSKYRTGRVFLTTASGQNWTDISGTDGKGPAGNLPDLPMHSVVFDTSFVPSALIVASDAGVMRSTDFAVNGAIGSATWKAYGVGLPTVSCSALAIDNSVNLPVLRVGTYGRSCFELTRPAGPRLYSGPNLAFGSVAIGRTGSLALNVYNCGSAPLNLGSITVNGTGFALNPPPAFPLAIAPGVSQSFQVTFSPAAGGDAEATFVIASNDPSSPATLQCAGRGVPSGLPRLAINPATETSLGTVTPASPRSIPIQLFNVGTADLQIANIALSADSSTDFSLSQVPALPVTISPGGELDVVVAYNPTSSRSVNATLTINSDDLKPVSKVKITGTGSGVPGA